MKNSVPQHTRHAFGCPDLPLKTKIERKTARRFQIVSLPQKDGSYVASVVEAPQIVVYNRSRRVAEDKAAQEFLENPDLQTYTRHPLSTTKAVTIDMEYDEDRESFVTYVRELHGISTFGETESMALDKTAEMIRGYIRSMEANRKKIPLTLPKLVEWKRAVGIH